VPVVGVGYDERGRTAGRGLERNGEGAGEAFIVQVRLEARAWLDEVVERVRMSEEW